MKTKLCKSDFYHHCLFCALTLVTSSCAVTGNEGSIESNQTKAEQVFEENISMESPGQSMNGYSISATQIRVTFSQEISAAQVNDVEITLGEGLTAQSVAVDTTDSKSLIITTDKNMLPKDTSIQVQNLTFTNGQKLDVKSKFLPATKLAFISSSQGNGNLSSWSLANGKQGVEAADEICNREALQAGYKGEFAAWISNSQRNAKDAFADAQGAWITPREDHPVFAYSLATLTSQGANAPLSNLLNGDRVQYSNGGSAFTKTSYTGMKAGGSNVNSYCQDWNSQNANLPLQEVGDALSSGTYWSKRGAYAQCASSNLRLYCLQKGTGHEITETASSTAKRIFITSVKGNGNLMSWPNASGASSGLAAADQICRVRAQEGGLGNAGNFKAWISTSTAHAVDRISNKNSSYRDVKNFRIANNIASFASGNLLRGITFDEYGTLITDSSEYVHTGTRANGQADINSCLNWESASSLDMSTMGQIGSTTERVNKWATGECDGEARLICIED